MGERAVRTAVRLWRCVSRRPWVVPALLVGGLGVLLTVCGLAVVAVGASIGRVGDAIGAAADWALDLGVEGRRD